MLQSHSVETGLTSSPKRLGRCQTRSPRLPQQCRRPPTPTTTRLTNTTTTRNHREASMFRTSPILTPRRVDRLLHTSASGLPLTTVALARWLTSPRASSIRL